MSIPTFTPGYPPDGSSLGQTKSVIRNNLDGTFLTLGVDHINNNGQPGSQPAGYHNVTHWVPQGSNPAPITGYGQLYSKTITPVVTDQALFWETGTGLIQQLTTNITPLAANTGYTFIPGGIIIQWGTVSIPNVSSSNPPPNRQTATQTFPIPFPTACFIVIPQYQASGTTISANTISIISKTKTDFTWNNTASSVTNYPAFYWFAIGN